MDRHIFPAWRLNSCFIKFLFILMSAFATFPSGTAWAVAPATDGGHGHTLSLANGGEVWAWGDNAYGQLGNNSYADSRVPVSVSGGLSDVSAISAGHYHSIALKSDGTVWTWGKNDSGQLGDNNRPYNRNAPAQITSLSSYVIDAASAGGYHTVVLRHDGRVVTWGFNAHGQLGNNSTTDSPIPVTLPDNYISGVVAIAAGNYHTVALKSDGTVWAWGLNDYGQLGYTTSSPCGVPCSKTPGQVPGLTNVAAIAAGGKHTLALKKDGTLWAWGRNINGELGNGTFTSSTAPVQVSGMSGAVAIAAGSQHSIALKNDGTVWTWGYNANYQLGYGNGVDSAIASQVPNFSGVTAISAGANHTIVNQSDGIVWAWGLNSEGQLGNDLLSSSETPVRYAFTPPTVTTGTVSGISSSGAATVVGFVNANNDTATVYFDYGTSTAYGSTVTATGNATGSVTQTFTAQLSSLTCGNLYHYRIRAANNFGTTNGADSTFVACVSTTYGDYNADARADILWRNISGGDSAIWFTDGTVKTSSANLNPQVTDLNWTIVGVGDFDMDGKSDVLWRHTDGRNSLWLMDGAVKVGGGAITSMATTWAVAGIGDFNGDGRSDILWRSSSTGENKIWFMNGVTISEGVMTTITGAWKVVGTGDFNWDGRDDILWQDGDTVNHSLWLMNGATKIGGGKIAAQPNANWKVAGVGDFSGDGKSDILWRHSTTGQNTMWFMNATTKFGGGDISTLDIAYSVEGISDFNGDGTADILWRSLADINITLWRMRGTTYLGGSTVGTQSSSSWRIMP